MRDEAGRRSYWTTGEVEDPSNFDHASNTSRSRLCFSKEADAWRVGQEAGDTSLSSGLERTLVVLYISHKTRGCYLHDCNWVEGEEGSVASGGEWSDGSPSCTGGPRGNRPPLTHQNLSRDGDAAAAAAARSRREKKRGTGDLLDVCWCLFHLSPRGGGGGGACDPVDLPPKCKAIAGG